MTNRCEENKGNILVFALSQAADMGLAQVALNQALHSNYLLIAHMAGSEFSPKNAIDLDFWQKHLLTKMFAGFDLVIWPKKAGTAKTGTLFTPCNRKSAVGLLEAGYLNKLGKYKDGKGVIYGLKEGVEEPQKTKKRRSRSKPKPAPTPVAEEELFEEVVATEEFSGETEKKSKTKSKSKSKK